MRRFPRKYYFRGCPWSMVEGVRHPRGAFSFGVRSEPSPLRYALHLPMLGRISLLRTNSSAKFVGIGV